ELIRATPSWQWGPPQHDCMFLNSNPDLEAMRGLDVVHIQVLFSFEFHGKWYPCALVHWFSRIGDDPDEDTGMWIVWPELDDDQPIISVIHLDCIVCAAHLIGVYGSLPIPKDLSFHKSLEVFLSFYVNKFIDHHAFSIAF
ncbi:hypothetical protein BJV74DRAFT_789958, partial [Russula compacta]